MLKVVLFSFAIFGGSLALADQSVDLESLLKAQETVTISPVTYEGHTFLKYFKQPGGTTYVAGSADYNENAESVICASLGYSRLVSYTTKPARLAGTHSYATKSAGASMFGTFSTKDVVVVDHKDTPYILDSVVCAK
jgi:hypothetical protein